MKCFPDYGSWKDWISLNSSVEDGGERGQESSWKKCGGKAKTKVRKRQWWIRLVDKQTGYESEQLNHTAVVEVRTLLWRGGYMSRY